MDHKVLFLTLPRGPQPQIIRRPVVGSEPTRRHGRVRRKRSRRPSVGDQKAWDGLFKSF